MTRRRSPAATVSELPVLAPMLATPGAMPTGTVDQWAYEVKWDGMRVVTYTDGSGGLRMLSRAGNDVAATYPELHVLSGLLPGRDLILDGEIIAVDDQGRPSFGRLQERMGLRSPSAVATVRERVPVTLMLFDVLWERGTRITHLPYVDRRALLGSLGIRHARVQVPPSWPGIAGEEAMAWTKSMELEGVIAKRLDSVYRPGARSRDWIKIKHVRTLDVVIGGWIPGGPGGTTLKALLVGLPEPTGLRYCGAVGTGFTQAERRTLAALMRRMATDRPPFTSGLIGLDRSDPVRWVHPRLTAQVEYLEFTGKSRLLRAPVWRGLRDQGSEQPPF